jgi:hypothetical protein
MEWNCASLLRIVDYLAVSASVSLATIHDNKGPLSPIILKKIVASGASPGEI